MEKKTIIALNVLFLFRPVFQKLNLLNVYQEKSLKEINFSFANVQLDIKITKMHPKIVHASVKFDIFSINKINA